MKPSLLLLAGALVLLAAPAAHAFDIQSSDSRGGRAALTDPDANLTAHNDGTVDDNGNRTVTTHFGDSGSSFSFSMRQQPSDAFGGMMAAPMTGPAPWPPGSPR